MRSSCTQNSPSLTVLCAIRLYSSIWVDLINKFWWNIARKESRRSHQTELAFTAINPRSAYPASIYGRLSWNQRIKAVSLHSISLKITFQLSIAEFSSARWRLGQQLPRCAWPKTVRPCTNEVMAINSQATPRCLTSSSAPTSPTAVEVLASVSANIATTPANPTSARRCF